MKEIYMPKDKNEKKEEKGHYYIVKADDIVFIDDEDKIISLRTFLVMNNVSPKYRRCFFRNDILSGISYEFVTRTIFNTSLYMEFEPTRTFIKGNSNLNKVLLDDKNGYQFYEGIYFNTYNTTKINSKKLYEFFAKMKEDGEFENYLKAITSFISYGIYYSRKRRIINELNNINESCLTIDADNLEHLHY